ncbi:gag/pol protein [Cucumis melo var. makuwa]|uniref:Gag/pol protein n=1 Tax=Cucumis melo var. makuwa TaxID=1194695 RepID=A0A5D3CEN7_CUCMM|nr:gag/pol protein [Cucumis melo var. makuwa]
MVTTRQIMDSLQEMFKGLKEGEENVAHFKRFQKGSSSEIKYAPSSSRKLVPLSGLKRVRLCSRHRVHSSKEQCSKTPQEVEDMRRIPYALDHWTVVKIILKYLRRTEDYMSVYRAKDLILTRYTNLDFQTNKDSRKFTSGSVFTMNRRAMVWRSINQGCIADSTIEVEYVVACEAAKEAIWLKNKKQEIFQRGDVIDTKIALEHNIVDPFTKTPTAKVFEGHLESLGL